MQPLDEARLDREETVGLWGRLALWMRRNRALAWLVALTAGLVLFLTWLPASVRMFFWRGLQSHAVLASMILGFGLLALSLTWAAGHSMDSRVFLLLNVWGPRPRWLDMLMTGFTQIGNSLASVALALLFYGAGNRLLAYELILGTLTLWLVVELVKVLARRRRPFLRLPEARIVGVRAGGRSFPSGHTSQAFFVATLLAGYFAAGVWVAGGLYALALLVGVTRIYVGAHYPRDVLAGAILGSAWGLLGGIIFGYAS